MLWPAKSRAPFGALLVLVVAMTAGIVGCERVETSQAGANDDVSEAAPQVRVEERAAPPAAPAARVPEDRARPAPEPTPLPPGVRAEPAVAESPAPGVAQASSWTSTLSLELGQTRVSVNPYLSDFGQLAFRIALEDGDHPLTGADLIGMATLRVDGEAVAATLAWTPAQGTDEVETGILQTEVELSEGTPIELEFAGPEIARRTFRWGSPELRN